MSKLVVENGCIVKQYIFKADTLEVRFRHAAITPAGDLGECVIKEHNGQTIVLTYSQAISLAKEIMRRCQL